MIKTGIILSDNFNSLTGLPAVFPGSFQDVERDFKQYKSITAFTRYWHVGEDANNPLNYDLINQFDAFFETPEEYQVWLNSTDIVPKQLSSTDISDCPVDATVTRKGFLTKVPEIDFVRNTTKMEVTVKHYRNDVYIPVEYPDQVMEFSGNDIIEREVEPGVFKTEFQLFLDLHNSGMKVWEIGIQEILLNDSVGLIDQNCNYGS